MWRYGAASPSDVDGGDPGRFDFSVAELATVGGQRVEVPPASVTIVVGANNSGKSTMLRELTWRLIVDEATAADQPTKVIGGLTVRRSESPLDTLAWLRQHVPLSERAPGFVLADGQSVSPEQVKDLWSRGTADWPALGDLARAFVHESTMGNRQGFVGGTNRRQTNGDPPTHPLHKLEDSKELRIEVADLAERFFGQKVTLDWLGTQSYLRMGTVPVPPPLLDEDLRDYRDALAALPTVMEQGDGVKSTLGILIPLTCAQFPVIVIDEPEAYLHPPQARLLGRQLGDLVHKRRIQLFVATHDRNILLGLLNSTVAVNILRLERRASMTEIHQLSPDRIKEVWEDPAHRYSNVLDGLFHRAVVLTEADGDCRFLSAALDSASQGSLPFPADDVLFVPAIGKDGILKLAKALTALQVPVVISADLDVLDVKERVRAFVTVLGGSWDDMQEHYRTATEQMNRPQRRTTCGTILALIEEVLKSKPEAPYDKATMKAAQLALGGQASPWAGVKEQGIEGLLGGEAAHAAADALLDALDQVGIVLIREGELECLAPTVARSKGAGWYAEAMRTETYTAGLAQGHIARVAAAIVRRTSSL